MKKNRICDNDTHTHTHTHTHTFERKFNNIKTYITAIRLINIKIPTEWRNCKKPKNTLRHGLFHHHDF